MKLIGREYDPSTGFTDEYYYDEMSNKLTIRRVQDVEDTLAANVANYNNHGHVGYEDSQGGAHHVARIPMVIIEKWKREDGFDWFNSTDKERRKKLNDPDNRKLLVRPGRL